jgi:hypothetical protein
MLLFNQGYCYIQNLHFGYVIQEDFVQSSRQWSLSPLHLSGRHGIPSGRSSIKQHSSGRRDLSVQTPICVQKLRTVPSCIHSDVSATRPDAFQCSTSKMISFPKHRYGKTAGTVRTTLLFHLNAILDKARHAEDFQLSGRQFTLSGRPVLIMKITCSKSTTVQTQPYSGKNINEFGKSVAHLVVRTLSDTVRTPLRENRFRLDLGIL